MSDAQEDTSPSPRREPLPWFKIHAGDLLTGRGVARALGDDLGAGALLRFLLYSHQHGAVHESELEDVCGPGAKALRPCLEVDAGGNLVLPYLERMRREAEEFRSTRAAAGRASANKRQHTSTRVEHEPTHVNQYRTVQDSTEEGEEKPPLPPSGADTKATTRSPRRVPAEPWESVLERSEYRALANDHEFMAAWWSWVTHTRTAGAKAREPRGSQAAAILNVALREGAARFAAAVEASIAGNWQGIHYPDVGRGSAPKVDKTDAAIARVLMQSRGASPQQQFEAFGEREVEVENAG